MNKELMEMNSNVLEQPNVSLTGQTKKLRKICRIGGGTYGRVYKALPADSAQSSQYPGSMENLPAPGSLIFSMTLPPSLPMKQKEETDVLAVKRNFISPIFNESIGSLRELDILWKVRNHPFCIETKDVSFQQPFVDGLLSPDERDQVSDKVYFVLEKGDLDGDHYIRPSRRDPQAQLPLVNEKKKFAVQILLGLEFIHSRGIYHRDLKPGNIICFLNPDGTLKSAKITDYGLAQYHESQSISIPGFVTLWYRSPEISLCKEYDYKVDVWSAGCILFELFSGTGTRFIQPSDDVELINELIRKRPFPKQDYILAQQNYPRKITRSYDRSQSMIPSLKEQLEFNDSMISQFNSKQLGGNPNFGTFEELVDILEHTLVINPDERWSTTQILNHSFFDGYREFIDQTRTQFGINSEGDWILKPIASLNFLPGKIRERGMKWFQIIYTNRNTNPICNWYTHRIFFHALEMFDRYLLLTHPPETTPDSDLAIWVNSFMFISSKYFRVLIQEFGLEYYSIGIYPEEFREFRSRVHAFEEHVIREVFQNNTYQTTIYETASEFLTETSIHYLVKLITQGAVVPGTSLEMIWSSCTEALKEVNRVASPVSSPTTPMVSLAFK